MSCESFKCVGPGEVLAYLRSNLRRATRSILIIGPWLDDYFAEQIVAVSHRTLGVRVLVRPHAEVEPAAWDRTLAALNVFARHWVVFEARHLSRLHAKCISIDEETVYIGSANWYRYSLETAAEVVLCGPAAVIDAGTAELESLWDQGERLDVQSLPNAIAEGKPSAEGISREVLDPLATQALRDNPKAFVLREKGKRLR